LALTTVLFLGCFVLCAQNDKKNWSDIISKSEVAWFASPEAIAIAENVLLYQRNIGGWPKNIQMQNPLTELDRNKLIALKNNSNDVTTDNGATCQEMLFLSKVNRQTPNERYEKAFLLGLHYLLEAQYENGGWPQFYPLKKGYYTHITYNDNLMVNILTLLKQIIDKPDYYTVSIPKETLEKVETAFDKGIKCILKTQYKQKEILTVWCAQYDENVLLPAKARAYELPSLSGKESAKIVLLLMTIENPTTAIVEAIESACAWFEKTKITTLKEVRTYTDSGKITEKEMISTENGLPIWARFMELEDNSPFFCDRDGIKKKSLQEIGHERRVGYAWYTDEPKEVLKRYPVWKKKYISDVTVKKKMKPKI
jgi:pectinesterase